MSVVPLSDANQTKEKQESLQMPKPWKCEISTLNERKISLKSANILNRVYVGQARSGHKRSNYVSVNTPDQSSTKCILIFWKRAAFQPLVLCSMAWPFSSKGKRTLVFSSSWKFKKHWQLILTVCRSFCCFAPQQKAWHTCSGLLLAQDDMGKIQTHTGGLFWSLFNIGLFFSCSKIY